jgi:hypothetical protein
LPSRRDFLKVQCERKVVTNNVDAGRAAVICGNRGLNQLFDFFDDSWSGAVTTMRWYREAILKIRASSLEQSRPPRRSRKALEHLPARASGQSVIRSLFSGFEDRHLVFSKNVPHLNVTEGNAGYR